MRRDKIIENLLKINGFKLARNKNHRIYKHIKCDKIFVTAKTTSDIRSIKNVIKQIKKYFEINDLGIPAL
jgi:predicted RNA binding protein YcfA (HicA-like mRNA interferase family)|tara:strand:+ start:2862 stop:3071 length:210 start_codon:yes stop_codon:yes gene_type:complete